MAQRDSRKRRKERQRARAEDAPPAEAGAEQPEPQDRMARGYARGRAKDEAARAALKPLQPGERPLAVTIAGLLALGVALANLISYLAGLEIDGERPALIGILLFTGLMGAAAYGCFAMRYWAVLGMQALLGILILLFCLFIIRARDLGDFAIAGAVILGAGTLFWFLVKAMARIQMPERPGAR